MKLLRVCRVSTIVQLILLASSCSLGLVNSGKSRLQTALHKTAINLEPTKEQPYEEENQEILLVNNLEDEIQHEEKLEFPKKNAENSADKVPATAPGCQVFKNGEVMVASDPTNILKIKPSFAQITQDSFQLSSEKDAPPTKRFSLPAIDMPLETLDRSRECFRLFYAEEPTVICAANTTTRSDWMESIIEAVFCFNSGNRGSKKPETEKGEEVSLPLKSTKEARWETQTPKGKSSPEENNDQEGDKTAEIEIANLMEGSPEVTVNGDPLPTAEAINEI